MVRWAALWVLVGCPAPSEVPACDDPEHHCLQGEIFDFLHAPLPGVELCAQGLEVPCAISDDQGAFALAGLPTEGDLVIVQSKEGFQTTANPVTAESVPRSIWGLRMLSDALVAAQRASEPEAVIPGRGALIVQLAEPTDDDPINWTSVTGATISTEPASRAIYLSTLYLPDAALAATSEAGFVSVINLEPGEVAVTGTAPGGSCRDELQSWAFTPGEPVDVPIFPDLATYVAIGCPGPPE